MRASECEKSRMSHFQQILCTLLLITAIAFGCSSTDSGATDADGDRGGPSGQNDGDSDLDNEGPEHTDADDADHTEIDGDLDDVEGVELEEISDSELDENADLDWDQFEMEEAREETELDEAESDPDPLEHDGEVDWDDDPERVDPAINWIQIPAGTFQMGCSTEEIGCPIDELPTRMVEIAAFEMTDTEITHAQYQEVMGESPWHFSDCGWNCPVEAVSWQDAASFCRQIGGRLPSEAEWEYAARAGSNTVYACGENTNCVWTSTWFFGNSLGKPHLVASKDWNSFGLYDMIGNVAEWVADWYHDSYENCPLDGSACVEPVGTERVYRGGSWQIPLIFPKVSTRDHAEPGTTASDVGFRCAREAHEPDGDWDPDYEWDVEADEEAVEGDTEPAPAFGVFCHNAADSTYTILCLEVSGISFVAETETCSECKELNLETNTVVLSDCEGFTLTGGDYVVEAGARTRFQFENSGEGYSLNIYEVEDLAECDAQ